MTVNNVCVVALIVHGDHLSYNECIRVSANPVPPVYIHFCQSSPSSQNLDSLVSN